MYVWYTLSWNLITQMCNMALIEPVHYNQPNITNLSVNKTCSSGMEF